MKIEFLETFVLKLNDQVAFINKDKPQAAKKFKSDLIRQLRDLEKYPYRHKKSNYFDSDSIREITFKGYRIIYKIDSAKGLISVFALVKYQDQF